MIGSELLRYNKNQKFLLFDFETMHLNLATGNFPWQCAFLIATQYQILEQHNIYINWGKKLKVSRDAARITGFNPELVKREGLDPLEAYKKFRTYLDNPQLIVVGHNILSFDTYVERIWAQEVGESHSWDYLNRAIDTNCLAKAIKKNIKPDMENFLAWQYRLTSLIESGLKTSLSTLTKEYNIETNAKDFHKGDKDIIYNLEIFKKQIREIEI